jgi:CheY-like chemotaxis protein
MSAEDALDMLAQASHTAVLIDIALPGMDGFELLEAIRSNENWSHLPCIAFTAYHSSLVKQRGGSRVRRLILQAT